MSHEVPALREASDTLRRLQRHPAHEILDVSDSLAEHLRSQQDRILSELAQVGSDVRVLTKQVETGEDRDREDRKRTTGLEDRMAKLELAHETTRERATVNRAILAGVGMMAVGALGTALWTLLMGAG